MNPFYREYLDAEIDRHGTNCIKWDYLERTFGRADLTAAWVADMDFRTAPTIQKALVERAQNAIYGYTDAVRLDKQAECGWIQRRYGVKIDPEWILFSAGVIDSLFFCVRALTEPTDAILIQPPVYGPFYRAVNSFGRKLAQNRLIETEDGWKMDFDDMEKQFASGVKMMILCSPHNPVGRVWSRDELSRVIALANRYGVIVIADEIHADFNMGVRPHTRILDVEGADRCVMLTSATKSFNLAGLRQSSCIIRNAEMREKVFHEMQLAHATDPNLFGSIAQRAAYETGDEWMDAVVEYIRENRDYVCAYLKENLPEIKTHPQEGTYLLWLDMTALGMDHERLKKMLVDDAHVALSNGTDFGAEGDRHFRLNLASPRRNMERVMENLNKAIRSR